MTSVRLVVVFSVFLAGASLQDAAFVSAYAAGGIDHRVHVDVPANRTAGRVARHVRFACERHEHTGAWSCGENWQMLWQVERLAGQCEAPLMGLDSSRASEQQVVLDVVDFFTATAGTKASVPVPACGRIRPATLCRISHISPGASWSSRVTAADFDVRFIISPSISAVVSVNRHCAGIGPCLVEIVRCRVEAAN